MAGFGGPTITFGTPQGLRGGPHLPHPPRLPRPARTPGVWSGNRPAWQPTSYGTQPGLAAPAGTPTPQPSSSTSGGDSGNGNLDPTALNNIAAYQFRVNNQVNALGLRDANASTSLQDTLGQLAYQQPRSDLSLEQGYNNRGGLFSSVYDQALGNLNQQFLDKQNAAQQKYDYTHALIANQIAGLQGGEGFYNTGQDIASTGRQSTVAAKTPAPSSGSSSGNNATATGTSAGGSGQHHNSSSTHKTHTSTSSGHLTGNSANRSSGVPGSKSSSGGAPLFNAQGTPTRSASSGARQAMSNPHNSLARRISGSHNRGKGRR